MRPEVSYVPAEMTSGASFTGSTVTVNTLLTAVLPYASVAFTWKATVPDQSASPGVKSRLCPPPPTWASSRAGSSS